MNNSKTRRTVRQIWRKVFDGNLLYLSALELVNKNLLLSLSHQKLFTRHQTKMSLMSAFNNDLNIFWELFNSRRVKLCKVHSRGERC
jgi:hypothetical protein